MAYSIHGGKMACVEEEKFYQAEQLPELLPIYYKRLFPFDLYYRWMNYGSLKKNYFTNREFSFTLKDDVYLRYQSFTTKKEFENEIISNCPYKIDIGAVYNFKPSDRRAIASLQATEKEFVLDIDLTDYDDVRTCCQKAKVCQKCWPFMTIAIKILHRALKDDFGFQHILWVFSGRRGVHCWVCDESARQLSNSARAAVVQYLTLVQGGDYRSKKVFLYEPLHPSITEALKVVREFFPSLMLDKQAILDSKEQCDKIISCCVDSKLKEALLNRLPKLSDSKDRWEEIQKLHEELVDNNARKKDRRFLEEMMLQMCYPRLDVNVSKGINHLLKAPFCVHPKTGQICVPIDPEKARSFNPASVPTVNGLIEEINNYDAKNTKEISKEETDNSSKIEDYKKTSLVASYKIFRNFVTKLESAWSKARVADNDSKMEF